MLFLCWNKNKMKVLVTGCAGLIGANFCEYLLQKTNDVTIIGVDDLSGGYIENVPKDDRMIFLHADLTKQEDQQHIEKHCDGLEYIWHFAAYAAEGLSPFIRQFNYSTNVIATAFLINCGIKYNVKRFVFTSSMAVYGKEQVPFDETLTPQPIDPYGIAKYACEMDLKVAYEQHNMEYCIIRPHNVYGRMQNIWDPYRNVLGIWMWCAMHNKPFTVYGDGEQTRAFSYIDNVIPCLFTAATDPRAKNQIINVGGVKEYTLNHAKEILSKITGWNQTVHLEPRHEVKHAWSTYQKSVDLLDYQETVDLEEGLRRMWEWVQNCNDKERKFWSQYELDKNIYGYWKLDTSNNKLRSSHPN